MAIWNQTSVDLACCVDDVRQRVLLPDEHGQGAAVDDHHLGARHSPALPAKIYLATAADVRVRMDLQPVAAAIFCSAYLGGDHRLERTSVRMAPDRVDGPRCCARQPHQPVFSEQHL